jgi:hypothetical protein
VCSPAVPRTGIVVIGGVAAFRGEQPKKEDPKLTALELERLATFTPPGGRRELKFETRQQRESTQRVLD